VNLTSHPEEQLLLRQAAAGDRAAFAALYTHYTPLLYRQLFPLTRDSKPDTEEIIQDVFLRIWEKKETLIALQSFGAYSFRIARNIMVDRHRRQALHKSASSELAHRAGGRPLTDPIHDDILFLEYQAIARQAIERLPRRQRQIFELRTLEDRSLGEIAGLLGISLAAVKKQLYTALRFIRQWLREHAGWFPGLLLLLARR
jgi:RNA polymerase sigma factor (sigma-70 family)